TKKIKIGMLGNLVPISNPLRVAEEYAMIDVMSEGRLIAGLMRGIPHEYVAYNFSPDESRARLAEAMRFIVKAWTEPEPFGWEGEFYSYPAVSIWPRPRQQPHPPIMVSASNEDSARFAAEARVIMGMAFLPNLVIAKEVVDTYRDHAQKTGWTPTTDHVLISCNTLIGEDETEIKNHLREGIRYFGQVLLGGPRTAQKLVVQKSRYFRKKDYATEFTGRVSNIRERTLDEGIEDGVILCGTPDQVVQQIKRVHSELGAGWININMKIGNVPNDVVKRSMELFRDHVLPHVRDLGDGGVIAGAGD
ncbi:MAG: LLM class flavin-dependent oxidoreductase, partial [Rhodospirillales bacterium]|nr:LLM class flavin-dependent oxidoreductase [Rhodospirillales bacterium]